MPGEAGAPAISAPTVSRTAIARRPRASSSSLVSGKCPYPPRSSWGAARLSRLPSPASISVDAIPARRMQSEARSSRRSAVALAPWGIGMHASFSGGVARGAAAPPLAICPATSGLSPIQYGCLRLVVSPPPDPLRERFHSASRPCKTMRCCYLPWPSMSSALTQRSSSWIPPWFFRTTTFLHPSSCG